MYFDDENDMNDVFDINDLVVMAQQNKSHNNSTPSAGYVTNVSTDTNNDSKKHTARIVGEPKTTKKSTKKNTKKKDINIVPTNKEITDIENHPKLHDSMRNDMGQEYRTDPALVKLILSEMDICDMAISDFIMRGNKLDFSWGEYTLRDCVIEEYDDTLEAMSRLSLYGLKPNDVIAPLERSESAIVVVMLYYAAPKDSEDCLSELRFFDILRYDENLDSMKRECVIRYENEF